MTAKRLFIWATMAGLLWVALVTWLVDAPYKGVPPQPIPQPAVTRAAH